MFILILLVLHRILENILWVFYPTDIGNKKRVLFGTLGFPPKAGFFAWEALGKVLTQEQLKRRGRALANRCFICCQEEETVDHLLVHCTKASILWQLMLAIVGVSWAFPMSVRESFLLGKAHL